MNNPDDIRLINDPRRSRSMDGRGERGRRVLQTPPPVPAGDEIVHADPFEPLPENVATEIVETMKKPLPSRLLIFAALLTVYLVWGSTYLAIRIALRGYEPFVMGSLRFAIGGTLLAAWHLLRGGRWPSLREWRNAAIVGVSLLTISNGSIVFAERTVGSGLAATAVATIPLWAALMGLALGSRPRTAQWIGIGLGLVGVGLLNASGELAANGEAALFLLVAALSWAGGTIAGGRLQLPSGLMNPAAQMLSAAVVSGCLTFPTGETWTLLPTSSAAVYALVYMATVGSLIAYSAYTYLMQHTTPALATSNAYVNPVVAVVLGVLIVGEQITGMEIVAMALVLAGVALIAAFNRVQVRAK